MERKNSFSIADGKSPLLKMAVGALVLVYLINCFSPLRLHVDTLRYFAIKDCIELGCPPDSVAAKDYLPYGYTGLLLLLSKIGLLKSSVIILINCAYLAGSVYIIKKIFGSTLKPFLFVLFVLLNWTMIKFVAHPLSEMQYLFFSVACLYFFYQFTKTKKLPLLLFAFVFAGLAFITRTVGIALAAALVAGLAWHYRKELLLLIKNNRIVVAAMVVLLAGVIVFSKQLGLNHYTGVLTKQFHEGVTITRLLEWHFTEWTEITCNTSIVKIFPYLPASSAKILFIVMGIALVAGIVYLLFIRKNSIPFIVKTYLVFYFILMFNWPFYDPRFWVPVIPLVIAALVQIPLRLPKLGKGLMYVFCAGYILLGIISIGYITYTSLNKRTFARTQANGVYRNEYETFFYGKPQSDTATRIDPVTLSVIQRYDR